MNSNFEQQLQLSLGQLNDLRLLRKNPQFTKMVALSNYGGESPVVEKYGVAYIAFSVLSLFFVSAWITLSLLILGVAGLFAMETFVGKKIKRFMRANRMIYSTNDVKAALNKPSAQHQLQVIEKAQQAGASPTQLKVLKDLALHEDIPCGWWDFVLNEANQSITEQKQYTVEIQKSAAEQDARDQIERMRIVDDAVPIENKTLQL